MQKTEMTLTLLSLLSAFIGLLAAIIGSSCPLHREPEPRAGLRAVRHRPAHPLGLRHGGRHQGGGLARLFIAGVSPITMDDVTSGFKILQSLVGIGTPPDELIDHNVRIDYGKLRHLILIDRRLNGNFGLLRGIIESGE